MPSRHTISLADPPLGENSRGIKPSRAMTVAFSLARRLSRPADASTNSQGPALVIVHSFTPAAQADLDIGHQPALWFARTTLSGNSLTMARLSAAFPPLYRDMPPSSSEGDFSCGPSPHRQPIVTRQRTGIPLRLRSWFLHIFLSFHGRRTYIELFWFHTLVLIAGEKHDSVT